MCAGAVLKLQIGLHREVNLRWSSPRIGPPYLGVQAGKTMNHIEELASQVHCGTSGEVPMNRMRPTSTMLQPPHEK